MTETSGQSEFSTDFFQTGKLLYCQQRSTVKCCFHQEKCNHWTEKDIPDKPPIQPFGFIHFRWEVSVLRKKSIS